MLDLIIRTWNKYKQLDRWKQVLLFIPIVLLGIVYLFFIIKPNSKKHVNHHKDYVDNQIKKEEEEIKELEREEKQIIKEQERLIEEIEENIEVSVVIDKEIEKAVNNSDIEELERLRKEINEL